MILSSQSEIFAVMKNHSCHFKFDAVMECSLLPTATGKVRDENINFESDRAHSKLEKIQTKQSMLSSKVSSSHQIPEHSQK